MSLVKIYAYEYLEKNSIDGSKWLFNRVKRSIKYQDIIQLDFGDRDKYHEEEFEGFVRLLLKELSPEEIGQVTFHSMSRPMKRHLESIIN